MKSEKVGKTRKSEALRILITRPTLLAQSLCEKIRAWGAIAESFPVIEMGPTPHAAALHSAIEVLNTANIAIFVSQAAVHFSLPLIKARWNTLPTVLFAAIGPATAKALQQFGIESVLIPKAPPYESESLLCIEDLQPSSITGKKIFLFQGNGGRDLLSNTLKERGARVEGIECYQRRLPTINRVETLQLWRDKSIDAIVTTSRECLNNLVILLKSAEPVGLKEIPLIVVGLRMFELANTLGFKHPILAAGADDVSILAALTTLRDTAGEINADNSTL